MILVLTEIIFAAISLIFGYIEVMKSTLKPLKNSSCVNPIFSLKYFCTGKNLKFEFWSI